MTDNFFIDADGVGGGTPSDSLTTYPLADRVGDARKPFATPLGFINALKGVGGAVGQWRARTGGAAYASFTATAVAPPTTLTLQGYQDERPTILGYTLDTATRLTVRRFLTTGTIRQIANSFVDHDDAQGRTRNPGSSPTGGQFLIDGANDCSWNVDLIYTGPLTGLTGPIVAMNFRAGSGVWAQSQNRNRIDGRILGFIEGINGPSVPDGQDAWQFGTRYGLEVGGLKKITDTSGRTSHSDALQFEGASSNLTIVNMLVYEGSSRVLLMPIQNNTGGVEPLYGNRPHTGLHIENFAAFNMGDIPLTIYSAPGATLLGLSIDQGGQALSTRFRISFNQTADNAIQPQSSGCTNVTLLGARLPGMRIDDVGGTVTWRRRGFNMFPSTAGLINYTPQGTDIIGASLYVDRTSDSTTGRRPDLHLQAGDPGINAGMPAADPDRLTRDFYGNLRTGTNDIGAAEFGATAGGPFTVTTTPAIESDSAPAAVPRTTPAGGLQVQISVAVETDGAIDTDTLSEPAGGTPTSGSTGPLLPTRVRQSTTGGQWSTPGNIMERASANTSSVGLNSATVPDSATVYVGWDANLPADATVTGITVNDARRQTQPQQVHDLHVQWTKNGVPVGADLASPAAWPTSSSVAVYGGPTATWTLTESQRAAAYFDEPGMELQVQARNDSATTSVAAIDYLELDVAWTLPATGAQVVTVTPAVEADTAPPVTARATGTQTVNVTAAVETDTATRPGVSGGVSAAQDTGIAVWDGTAWAGVLGVWSGTAWVNSLVTRTTTGWSVGRAGNPRKIIQLTAAIETDTVPAVRVGGTPQIQVGIFAAVETDTATVITTTTIGAILESSIIRDLTVFNEQGIASP